MQADIESAADQLTGLFQRNEEAPRLSDTWPDIDLPTAYQISAAVRQRRVAQGDRWVGRKIGFTNRNMWEVYEVKAPFWGAMYESSVRHASGGQLSLAGFPNPKIEPEIVFGLRSPPSAGMDERALLGCVEWVALGFELVSSIVPGWTFRAADAIAAFGLHASLVTGEHVPVEDANADDWIERLASFKVTLRRDGGLAAEGSGTNVLGSPLSALRHLNGLVNEPSFGPPLGRGEIITTGTLTLAMPVEPGEIWLAEPNGIDLPPISVVTR